jgi:hypothetical protein
VIAASPLRIVTPRDWSNHDKTHSENVRIKRAYFSYLRAARGLNEASIDVVAAAIARFEDSTGHRPFKNFHIEQATALLRRMEEAISARESSPSARRRSFKP